jgi:outer membrane receptor protein involved in Fe transport
MHARPPLTRRARVCASTALIGLLATGALSAQTTGRLEGQVRDGGGGPLAAADILLSSASLQGVRTVRTDAEGRYWVPALPPGTYSVTVALAGHHPETKSILVSLDARATLDFVLQAEVREVISVSGETPLIDTSSAQGGTSYTSDVISRLPVQRNYADVVRSNPAVDSDRGDTQGRAVALTIYGATSAENLWIVDGVNTTNAFMGQQGKAINSEFIQEVEVKTDGYAAEYGRALGGVVNVVTKSGGNVFHGDGFFYYDSGATSAMQRTGASDMLEGESLLVDHRRLDFGADVGGYLVKDRLWFFGAYDRIDFSGEVSPRKDTSDVTTAERFPIDETDDLYSAKLTWNVAPPTTIVATVFADPSSASGAAGADPRQGPSGRVIGSPAILNRDRSTWYSARTLGGTDYGLRATQIVGAAGLAAIQGGYHRDRNLLSAPDLVRTEDLTCAGGTPEMPCSQPEVPRSVEGGIGWIDGQKDHNLSSRWQIRGDYTFLAGEHELKAGADYESVHSDMTYSVTGAQLVSQRNELGRAYYVHRISAVSGDDRTQLSEGRFRASLSEAGVFVQDTWKPAPGLTVNAGIRWDGETLKDYSGAARLRLEDQWQPRVGVVWDPWRNGATKAYVSIGRFDFAMPTVAMTWWFTTATGMDVYNFDPLSLTPDPNAARWSPDFDPADTGSIEKAYITWFGGGPTGTPADPHLREAYQDELTFGVERLLDPSFVVGVKATYRRLGGAIEDRCDFVDSDGNPLCAIVNPGSGEPYARGDAPLSPDSPGGATPPARRLWRGIELVARKSFGTAAWLQASYVYSSLRGNYDGAVNERDADPVPGRHLDFDWPQLWQNAYGRLFLDRPHHFRLDAYWTVPFRLTVGVQAFAVSGPPLDQLGYFADTQTSSIYLVPRGSAGRLATQWEANLSLAYPISVGPATVTLQAYLYNAFNNQLPMTRDDVATTGDSQDPNPNYGKITSRQAPRSFRAAVRVSF